MADEKRTGSIPEMAEKKALHLQTVDADVNMEDLYGEERKKKEKALVRKVDIRMMPLMMLLCKWKIHMRERSWLTLE
jgi:hypothetical protein